MKRALVTICLVVFLVFCLGNDGCDKKGPQKSASGAQQVRYIFKVPLNSKGNTVEQQNILDRLRVTTDPTKVMWIHLIALDGKIIRRMPVRCKVTSSGKRLEPVHAASSNQYGMDYPRFTGYETDEFIQADGTYGISDPYIFWFDPPGRYHQWGTAGGLGYLKTDYPIDLKDPVDVITGLYKVDQAARQWQEEQEEILRKQEGPAYEKWKKEMGELEETVKKSNQ